MGAIFREGLSMSISSLIKEEDRIAGTGDRLQLPERSYEINWEPFERRNAIEVVDADSDDTPFSFLVEGDPLDPVEAWIGKTEVSEVHAFDLEGGHRIAQVPQVLSPVDVRIRKVFVAVRRTANECVEVR